MRRQRAHRRAVLPMPVDIFAIGETGCNCTCGSSSCQICVTVTTCAGLTISGATVVISPSGTSTNTCTTNSSGQCCIDVTSPGSGSYNVSVSKAGYYGSNQNITVTCPGTTSVTLVMVLTSGTAYGRIWVSGCNGAALQGATVTIGGGSYTTLSTGYTPYFALASGSNPWTSSYPGLVNVTGTITVTCTGGPYGASAFMNTAATGYACCGCNTPYPTTIYVSGPAGNFVCTWSGTDSVYIGCGPVTGSSGVTCSNLSCGTGSSAYCAIVISCTGHLSIYWVTTTCSPNTYFSSTGISNCSSLGTLAFTTICGGLTINIGQFLTGLVTCSGNTIASGTWNQSGTLEQYFNGTWIATA